MMNKPTIGVLLTNTGTPDAPTKQAVKAYLKEFLSDKRIVQLPRLLWLPILHGLVLTTRPKKSAWLYQHIWTDDGSPLRVYMEHLRHKLAVQLAIPVEIGMNYGNPSIATGLQQLSRQGVEKMIVIPLFPQYSETTTASSIDRVTQAAKSLPLKIQHILSYATHHHYIRALAQRVREHWHQHGSQGHLLISFHGIPEAFVKKGDPYQRECEQTANALAQALDLSDDAWSLCYQSQFGYAKWLQPATFSLLSELPKRGIKQVDVICPGFAVDCLETLEEIAMRGQQVFHQAGGTTYRYISALNDRDEHVGLLAELITQDGRGMTTGI